VSISSSTLRPYAAADEDAAIELWRRTWQLAYPDIDFAERLDWWRERWRTHTVPTASIIVAERGGEVIGFVTIDTRTEYLDQLVVAPETWGSGSAEALLREAKRLSPHGIDLHVNQDNVRAIRFYEKHGFGKVAESVNPRSGRLVHLMRWRP
jgi:putative acetyltransferase